MLEKAIELIDQLERNGFECFIVGGYPRDQLLGIETSDIDLCTNATPEDMGKLFVVKKEHFGSMIVEYQECNFEITTYRKEGAYQDHRRPDMVQFVTSLKEDLKRRDFVMNTLALDKNGTYIDLLGARNDIEHKLIRTVGDPYTRIKEDSLRILRAIRFQVVLGFKMDETLKKAILEQKKSILFLSKKRIYEELHKMFSKNPEEALQCLKDYEIDQVIDVNEFLNKGLTPDAIVFLGKK